MPIRIFYSIFAIIDIYILTIPNNNVRLNFSCGQMNNILHVTASKCPTQLAARIL